jgi:hypothetical protein
MIWMRTFCWAGDKDELDYGVVTKSKLQFPGYMTSLNHSLVVPTSSLASLPVGQQASSSPYTCISLPDTLLRAIRALSKSLIWGDCHANGVVVANTGMTDHMLLGALAFISY